MKSKVAILGAHIPIDLRQKSQEYIIDNGFEADILEMGTRNINDYKEKLIEYEVLITYGEKVPAEAISYLSKNGRLKLLSRGGVGTDEIDHIEATKQGVAICNAAGTLSVPVAECTLALIINVLREFPQADRDVRKGDWGRFFNFKASRQLEGKTVGLVGFGDISKALAKMLYGFDCNVIACDINFDKITAKKFNVRKVDLKTIQKTADVVSLHVPAVPETIHMIDKGFLSGMKRDAILINTGRGKLVKEEDLIEALQNGVIAGAGLDVFENEPLDISSPFTKLDNVMLLPHYAATTEEAVNNITYTSAKNAVDFLSGKKVETILNSGYIKNIKIKDDI